MCEETNVISVSVNGNAVTKKVDSDFDVTSLSYDIADLINTGLNEIVIEMNYYQSEDVYYALFGENVTESLKNCLAYDSDIEPIYLKGNFGVYGEFENSKRNDVIIGDNFVIGKQKSQVECLISDGFPFFKGDMKVKQNVTVDATNYELVIKDRFHVIDVTVNGNYAGRMMFTDRIDVSKYLIVGTNEIELTISVGLRNLLGPFHDMELEPNFVGPDTYERFGSWQNGKSNRYFEKYAFKKGII